MKFIALLFFPVFSFDQIKLDQKISLLDDKIEILAPTELTKMSDKMWVLKYHTLPRPELALSDENGEVNLLVDLTQQPASESQIAAYKDFRISNLQKTRTDIKILGEGIKSVNGRNVGFIKFSSQASDQNIFNFYFFAIANGKVLLFNFNCPAKLQKKWEETADKILNSLKIIESK
jgi:hypothetical protein